MGDEKKPQKARVFEVRSPEDLKNLLSEIMGVPMGTTASLGLGGPPDETAMSGAMTALHQCAHDLLVADGIQPTEQEVGTLAAKLLARGLKEFVKNGPPSNEERDAFNIEWDTQSNIIAPPDPTCPCPRCRKHTGRS
jgi:hypothetical protein